MTLEDWMGIESIASGCTVWYSIVHYINPTTSESQSQQRTSYNSQPPSHIRLDLCITHPYTPTLSLSPLFNHLYKQTTPPPIFPSLHLETIRKPQDHSRWIDKQCLPPFHSSPVLLDYHVNFFALVFLLYVLGFWV